MRSLKFYLFFFLCFLLAFPALGQCADELVVLYTGDTVGHVEPCG